MKKFIAMLLALAMVLSFAGCAGSKTAPETTPATEAPATEAPVVETEAPATEAPVVETEAAVSFATTIPAEGVMTYEEYVAAELDSPVVVETCIQAKQSWWNDQATFYTQNGEGGYFIYNMPCSEEDYNNLTVGTWIRVSGFKAEWAGEVEIMDATYEILDGNFVAEPLDVTALLGTEELIAHQNEYVSFSTMKIEPSVDAEGNEVAFLYNWDGSGQPGNDLYFNASIEGTTYTFTVESYLTGDGTDVYEAVEALQIGNIVDMTGYLYWYEGVNPHITSIALTPKFAPVDEATEAGVYDYLQGTWEYDDSGIHYEIIFDGYNVYVTATISGQAISNEGTYQIGASSILVTYTNGQMAYMDYEWNGVEVTLYYLTGLM